MSVQKAKGIVTLLTSNRVLRYHTRTTIRAQSLGEHVAGVAQIVRFLGGSDRAVVHALSHDSGELYAGDLPAPFKWDHPSVADAHSHIEQRVREAIVGDEPELSARDRYILKIADLLELIAFVTHERALGNRTLDDIAEAGRGAVVEELADAMIACDIPLIERVGAFAEALSRNYEGNAFRWPTFTFTEEAPDAAG